MYKTVSHVKYSSVVSKQNQETVKFISARPSASKSHAVDDDWDGLQRQYQSLRCRDTFQKKKKKKRDTHIVYKYNVYMCVSVCITDSFQSVGPSVIAEVLLSPFLLHVCSAI